MNLWVQISVWLIWAFAGWQSWRGLRLGKVRSRSGDFYRDRDPAFFWSALVLYLGATLLVPLLMAGTYAAMSRHSP